MLSNTVLFVIGIALFVYNTKSNNSRKKLESRIDKLGQKDSSIYRRINKIDEFIANDLQKMETKILGDLNVLEDQVNNSIDELEYTLLNEDENEELGEIPGLRAASTNGLNEIENNINDNVTTITTNTGNITTQATMLTTLGTELNEGINRLRSELILRINTLSQGVNAIQGYISKTFDEMINSTNNNITNHLDLLQEADDLINEELAGLQEAVGVELREKLAVAENHLVNLNPLLNALYCSDQYLRDHDEETDGVSSLRRRGLHRLTDGLHMHQLNAKPPTLECHDILGLWDFSACAMPDNTLHVREDGSVLYNISHAITRVATAVVVLTTRQAVVRKTTPRAATKYVVLIAHVGGSSESASKMSTNKIAMFGQNSVTAPLIPNSNLAIETVTPNTSINKRPPKYRLRYRTKTGEFTTPWNPDLELLRAWVRSLHHRWAVPHFIDSDILL